LPDNETPELRLKVELQAEKAMEQGGPWNGVVAGRREDFPDASWLFLFVPAARVFGAIRERCRLH